MDCAARDLKLAKADSFSIIFRVMLSSEPRVENPVSPGGASDGTGVAGTVLEHRLETARLDERQSSASKP